MEQASRAVCRPARQSARVVGRGTGTGLRACGRCRIRLIRGRGAIAPSFPRQSSGAKSRWPARRPRRLSVVRVVRFFCSVFPASFQLDEKVLAAHLLSEFRPTADAQLYPFLFAGWRRAEQAVYQQDRILS